MPSISALTERAALFAVLKLLRATLHAAGPAAEHERADADDDRGDEHRRRAALSHVRGGNAVVGAAQVEAALSAPSSSRRGSCRPAALRLRARPCGRRSGAGRGCAARLLRKATGRGRRCRAGPAPGRCRRGRGTIRSLETETRLQIADVLGRGNARFTILIHETPPAWLRHARYVCSGGCGSRKKQEADTATTEARTILTPSKPVKRTPPKHSVFVASANERRSTKLKLSSS